MAKRKNENEESISGVLAGIFACFKNHIDTRKIGYKPTDEEIAQGASAETRTSEVLVDVPCDEQPRENRLAVLAYLRALPDVESSEMDDVVDFLASAATLKLAAIETSKERTRLKNAVRAEVDPFYRVKQMQQAGQLTPDQIAQFNAMINAMIPSA